MIITVRVDNIIGLSNSHTKHNYTYDAMNRLVSANGSSKGVTYDLQMSYDKMGKILRKNQTVSSLESTIPISLKNI